MLARCVLTLLFASAAVACGEPSLDHTRFSCVSEADCESGYVCGRVSGQRACVPAAQTPIRVGMSGPLQGPSQDLGGEMRRGIEARFAEVNRGGGLFGRRVELDCRNDDYDPEIAAQITGWVNYICPVPAAKDLLLAQGEDDPYYKQVAESPLVFPTPEMEARLHHYKTLSEEDEAVWNDLFGEVVQG